MVLIKDENGVAHDVDIEDVLRAELLMASLSNDHEKALSIYDAFLEHVNPNDPENLIGKAECLVELGRYSEAIPLINQVTSIFETTGQLPSTVYATLQYLYGRVYEYQGDKETAIECYETALRKFPLVEAKEALSRLK